jgi:hypothetical protein
MRTPNPFEKLTWQVWLDPASADWPDPKPSDDCPDPEPASDEGADDGAADALPCELGDGVADWVKVGVFVGLAVSLIGGPFSLRGSHMLAR